MDILWGGNPKAVFQFKRWGGTQAVEPVYLDFRYFKQFILSRESPVERTVVPLLLFSPRRSDVRRVIGPRSS